MFKYQLFKPSRLRFDNWVFGPQKFAGPSKTPETFRAHFGFLNFVLSPKRSRLEPRNFAVILIFILSTTYEKTSFTEEASRSFFRAQKFFGTIEKRASGLKITYNMKNKQIKVKSWSASNSRRNCVGVPRDSKTIDEWNRNSNSHYCGSSLEIIFENIMFDSHRDGYNARSEK